MPTRPRAFVLADSVLATVILATMTMVLLSAVAHQRITSERLADSRNAVRFAEQALLDLRQGDAVPAAPQDMHIAVEPVKDAQAINGFTWTRVTVRCNRASTTLLGLAKAGAEKKP